MVKPELSVIIATRNRLPVLQLTLNKLKMALDQETSVEVIVVDDHSEPPLVLSGEYNWVKLIRNEGKGVAAARNTGTAASVSDVLLLLDDDMWVPLGIFNRIHQLMKEYSGTAFNFIWEYPASLLEQILKTSFGRFLVSNGFTTMKGWCRSLPWNDHELFKINHLAGASLLIRATDYRMAGGFDSTFPLAGAEDYDFSKRMERAGIEMLVDPLTLLYHNELHKTHIEGFMNRVYQNAITRRHAAEIGYSEFVMHYGAVKKVYYSMIHWLSPLLIGFVNWQKNNRSMDIFAYRIYHMLIGNASFRGYQGLK
jgi:glycosyltransferase involved in cell wall biosynthesis